MYERLRLLVFLLFCSFMIMFANEQPVTVVQNGAAQQHLVKIVLPKELRETYGDNVQVGYDDEDAFVETDDQALKDDTVLEKRDDGFSVDLPKKNGVLCTPGDSELKFGLRLRLPEFFYGKNLRLLNDANPTDRVIYFRHIADFMLQYRYGQPKVPYDMVYLKMTIRNKGVWGDPESIASTNATPISELGTSFGNHTHGIPLHFLWIRELWIQFALNDLLCLPFCTVHTLTVGAFPFELGRGIALGAAYAIDVTDLGFISEYAVDQYAFGAKLSGELVKDVLTYDLYGAILDNKSATFSQTNQTIRGQQYHHRNNQARGFGIINYLVAARMRFFPKLRFKESTTRIEPYMLYNHNPEQRVEFRADAKSDLVTLGIASESEWGRFEWGFDTAFNYGNQTVYGWDRNITRVANRDGMAVIENSRVMQEPPGEQEDQRFPNALVTPANQTIIDTSPQTSQQNGKVIGSNDDGRLINDSNRFSDRFVNKFRGSMMVFDMGYTICKPDLKVCAGMGYASGDANPNRDEQFAGDSVMDEEYEGFIGLQEVYSGTRIRSAFLLAGAGRIPRILTFPAEDAFNPFPTAVSRFTNLLYVGASAYYRPKWSTKKWSFNPNILAYWNDFPTPFFNADTLMNSVNRFARAFLGVEYNIFVESELLPDLKFYAIGSIFVPGNHYRDIKGRPLNKAQLSFIDNLDKTGIINDRVPLLGDDNSYFCNMGLMYTF